jgi:GNAT superfamily N-acetyltransferase
MFDGVSSPCTQTFGLGLFEPATPDVLQTLEDFFRQRGAPIFHEVSPLADAPLFALLGERGYRPVEFTSVLYRPINRAIRLAAPPNERLKVRVVGDDEAELWARTLAEGWSGEVEFSESALLELGRTTAQRANALPFLAELDSRPVAAGAMSLHGGVALLAGASTIPAARRQGAQLALLESRLRHAAERGCDLAMMGALPGSASQRNAERHGFRIAYTRVKWQLVEATLHLDAASFGARK